MDLHQGKVKQIVGSSLSTNLANLITNFISDQSAALGAVKTFPNGLQVGEGISLKNAQYWIEQGAPNIIVTSCLFNKDGQFDLSKLQKLVRFNRER